MSTGAGDDPAPPALRIREAARALVIDPDHRVLLVRFEFPNTGTHWATPGGGVEPGETAIETIRRELREEVGLERPDVGPPVWTRLHIVPFVDGRFDGQREVFHLVRTAAFDPRPTLSWAELEAEYVFELRWWTLDEIEAHPGPFLPRSLGVHLRALLAEGVPNPPVDVGA